MKKEYLFYFILFIYLWRRRKRRRNTLKSYLMFKGPIHFFSAGRLFLRPFRSHCESELSASSLTSTSKIFSVFFKKNFFKKSFFLMFIDFWERERERERERARGREREGDTESEAGSGLWAVKIEPSAGLELTNHEIVTWAKVGCLTDWATQAPHLSSYPCLSNLG